MVEPLGKVRKKCDILREDCVQFLMEHWFDGDFEQNITELKEEFGRVNPDALCRLNMAYAIAKWRMTKSDAM